MPRPPEDDPLTWFDDWMNQARASSEPQPTATSLATVDSSGQPTARIVLLKAFDRKGFTFYTNLNSAKARDLDHNRRAGLCFLWKSICRQVRIDGDVEPLDDAEADAYFATRPRGSQIGAWASKQSQRLADRDTLVGRVEHFEKKFAGGDVPRPDFWGGFRIVPRRFEFWQERDHRLHDRWQFDRTGDDWQWEARRLYP